MSAPDEHGIERLRLQHRLVLGWVFEQENLSVEAGIDGYWIPIDSMFRGEAAEAQAAEDPTARGGNGSEPASEAEAPAATSTAEASTVGSANEPKKKGGGRTKGTGGDMLVAHLRIVEDFATIGYDRLLPILKKLVPSELIPKHWTVKNLQDAFSRGKANHNAKNCPWCKGTLMPPKLAKILGELQAARAERQQANSGSKAVI